MGQTAKVAAGIILADCSDEEMSATVEDFEKEKARRIEESKCYGMKLADAIIKHKEYKNKMEIAK